MSAKAGRHSLERDQGLMPTEALSAQRLLGEEGKRGVGGGKKGRAPVSEQASPESQEPSVASIKR